MRRRCRARSREPPVSPDGLRADRINATKLQVSAGAGHSSRRPATPSARLTPIEASSESGCSTTDLSDPPISAFAPTPTPSAMSPLAPTYRPVSARGGKRSAAGLHQPDHAATCADADIEAQSRDPALIGFAFPGIRDAEDAGHALARADDESDCRPQLAGQRSRFRLRLRRGRRRDGRREGQSQESDCRARHVSLLFVT